MTVRTKSAVLKTAAVAACALSIIAGTVFPSHLAIARSASSAIPNIAPGFSVVMAGQAATVVSTVHYQAFGALICSFTNCQADFPQPGANRQLNVTRISCYFGGTAGSTYSYRDIELRKATGAVLLAEHLPVDSSNAYDGIFLLNRAVDLQIAASQHMHVALILESGTVIGSNCSATGTLSTLG